MHHTNIIGETECKVYGTPLYYLYKFFVNLNLFQIIKFIKTKDMEAD